MIGSIFLDEPTHHYSCADIFQTVSMVWKDNESGETLVRLIQEECGPHIRASIKSLEGKYNDDDPSVFLTCLEEYRVDFLRKMEFLCSICGGNSQRVRGQTLGDILLMLLPSQLSLASELCGKVLSKILQMIRDQRSGKFVDMTQLKSLMEMFHGHYLHDSLFFGKPLLEGTAEFYTAEAVQVFEQSDLPQYLKHVKGRLREEKEKCQSLFCFGMFMDEVIAIVEREFLVVRASAIIEKGFVTLMDENRRADLGIMYRLFSEADLLGHLDEALRSYILDTGRKMLAQGSSSLADFMASVDQICFASFLEDPSLEKTADECFMELGLSWKDRFALFYGI
ncbi:unnamed protein product [Microthlaspi erraticum]|uniref:Cullin N-terminal domain-containing protein n=1 Tax=Microthlaspi erraticum TaxID=1685480 RepID=A0A6D2JIJ9_9BRAS|nr:unnamed protein product [Microthlaspi erraticum]